MSRMIFFGVLVAVVLVDASRDDDLQYVAVTPKHFQKHEAMVQLHEADNARPQEAEKSKPQKAAKHSMLAGASSQLSEIKSQSKSLRESLTALGNSSGLDASALRHQKSAQQAEARASLRFVASESKHVQQIAAALDQRIATGHQEIMESEVHVEADATAEKQEAWLNQQFVEMGQQTERIRLWYDDMKLLRQARDIMWAKRVDAVKEAEAAGLSPEEVQKELYGESLMETGPAKEDKQEPGTAGSPDSQANDLLTELQHKARKGAEPAPGESWLVDTDVRKQQSEKKQNLASVITEAMQTKQLAEGDMAEAKHLLDELGSPVTKEEKQQPDHSEKNQNLANVVANSALEMAQIEHASNEVMTGLSEMEKWKQSADNSPESAAKAKAVKEKLDRAMAFLKEHEATMDAKSDQIDDLMRQANMGPL